MSDVAEQSKESANAAQAEKRSLKRKPMIRLDSEVLGDVEVRLTAILGKGSIRVSELLNLSAGDVINLDTPLNGHVDLTLNDRLIAKGEIVAVEDRFGVRITQILAQKE